MSWQTNDKGLLRRPAPSSGDLASPQSSPSRRREHDYYDDSDEQGVKGNKTHKQMYNGACSLGRFCLNPCLCLVTAAQRICCRPQQGMSADACRRPSMSPRGEPFCRQGPSRGLLFMLLVVCMLMFWPRQSHRSLRHSSDWSLDNTPILIKLFDYSDVNDIGGWRYSDSKRFHSMPTLVPSAQSKTAEHGLTFGSLKNASPSKFRRKIADDDQVSYEQYKKKLILQMDKTYIPSYYDHLEERLPLECRTPNFADLYFPNCNRFHEFDIARDYDPNRLQAAADLSYYDSYLFSHGYYRDAWMMKAPGPNHLEQNCVLKQVRWKHKINMKQFIGIQKDALVMERLTSSPRILNTYGHCFMSMLVQPMSYEVEEYIVPGSGMANQDSLDKLSDVQPKNDYNVTEKLEIALAMAESIADLHGYEGGVIVHDDIQLCQWLRNEDYELILGDFNRAEVMDWNVKEKKYCKYNNGKVYGNYRSPEEMRDDDLDEQIDIYSFGNNIYALLTGLWVFYENDDDGVVQEKVSKGQRAYIDDRYRNHSFVEGKLVELMERCWIEDPSERVDIFEAVRFLREVLKEHKKQINKKKT